MPSYAAISAAESGLQGAHDHLGIPQPGTKTLPRLLASLRRKTNLEDLLGADAPGRGAVRGLSSMVENLYQVGHVEGDRHGGTEAPTLSATGTTLFVGGCVDNASCLIPSGCGIAEGPLVDEPYRRRMDGVKRQEQRAGRICKLSRQHRQQVAETLFLRMWR